MRKRKLVKGIPCALKGAASGGRAEATPTYTVEVTLSMSEEHTEAADPPPSGELEELLRVMEHERMLFYLTRGLRESAHTFGEDPLRNLGADGNA